MQLRLDHQTFFLSAKIGSRRRSSAFSTKLWKLLHRTPNTHTPPTLGPRSSLLKKDAKSKGDREQRSRLRLRSPPLQKRPIILQVLRLRRRRARTARRTSRRRDLGTHGYAKLGRPCIFPHPSPQGLPRSTLCLQIHRQLRPSQGWFLCGSCQNFPV